MNQAFFDKHGLGADDLKKFWTSKADDKREKLTRLIAGRLKDGIDAGLRDHKIYWAVDLAYDTPFAQTSYTLVKHILSRQHKDTAEVYDALHKWGLNLDDVMRESVDPRTGIKKAVINIPAFYKLLIPLVKAYTTIRQAKLFNDRNQNPLFKYEPVRFTMKNRVVGEVITDVISRVANEYGYSQVLRQIILQTLRYGICLVFPQEEWHVDRQLDESGEEKIIREGLRYVMPHPTRMAYDPSHRLSTINTDSGTNWALYWQIDTFSNLTANDKYWNTDNIPYGRNIKAAYPTYFQEVYQCAMNFPGLETAIKTGAGESDREKKVAIYQSADEDKAIVKTEYFMKLVPSKYGMGDYKHPLWFRFVVAGDDTVMWCAPLPYNPIMFYGYDFDDMRTRNAGLGLEILPFEDALGNVLSQWILSVKQNLSRAVFYDTNQVDAEVVEGIENLGHRRFSGVPFVPFDSRKAKTSGNDIKNAFVPVHFPEHNTEQISALLNSILSILERVLVLSSQEIGQASSHEQTAEESRIISANTSTRMTFTGTFIDDGIDAWKRQLYAASRAYMDDEVASQVTMDQPETKQILDDLGFEMEDKENAKPLADAKIKVPIKAKWKGLELESFINVTRDGEERTNSAAVAASGMQLLQVALGNPITAAAIGPAQALDMISQFAVMAGLPRDFRLKVAQVAQGQPEGQPGQPGQPAGGPPPMEAVQQLVIQAAQEVQQSVLKQVEEKIAVPISDQLAEMQKGESETKQVVSGLLDNLAQMKKMLEGLAQVVMQPPAPPPPPPVPAPNDQNLAPPVVIP